MCSSENELIHDVRQVHLEEMIMKNEEQFVMVPVRLSSEQASLVGPIVAHDWGIIIQHASAPIPPCADVESIAWMAKASKETPTSLREVVGNIPYNRGNYDDLVFRTDMEAQVARVAAEKDAEIARLSAVLLEIVRAEPSIYDGRYLREIARTALKEGSNA
ncbi:hypothetical protein [Komagataeibacter intermedius]|uniref:hypothetical protein n=1 Tax=Komagataeibacter intermedius TaxID=66229 RepID=UPI003B4379A3